MVNLVSEEEVQTKKTVEISESAPEVEVITEADVGSVENILSQELNFSPLENPKILNQVKGLHRALMKISGVDFWRNDGKSKYLAYFVPKKNSIFGIHLNKNRARGTLKKASEDGKKNLGDVGVKIGEDGLTLSGESITQKELLAKIRAYRKARGWA